MHTSGHPHLSLTVATPSFEVGGDASSSHDTAFDYNKLQQSALSSMPMTQRGEFEERRLRILSDTGLVKDRLQKVMEEKLNPTTRYHYCHYDEGKDPRVQMEKMREFIQSDKLNSFIEKTVQILSLFRRDDMDSIGTRDETQVAKAFKSLVRELEAEGFSNGEGKPRNFWSGDLARGIAYADEGFLSDSKIPTISVLFDLCWLIQQSEADSKRNDLYSLLPSAISSLYALDAKDPIHVFLSSNKSSEPPALQAGNHFWEGELPVLIRRANQCHEMGLPSPKIEFILAVDKRENPDYRSNDPIHQIPLRSARDDEATIKARPYNESIVPLERFNRIPVMRRMVWRDDEDPSVASSSTTPHPDLYESPEERKAYYRPRPMDHAELDQLFKAQPRKTVRAGTLQGCIKTFLATYREWKTEKATRPDSLTLGQYAIAKRGFFFNSLKPKLNMTSLIQGHLPPTA